jgi:hypothetical protein
MCNSDVERENFDNTVQKCSSLLISYHRPHSSLILENGTVRLTRNAGKELPLLAASNTQDRCCRLLRGGTLKLRVVSIVSFSVRVIARRIFEIYFLCCLRHYAQAVLLLNLGIVKYTELHFVLLGCSRRRCSSILKALRGVENKNHASPPPSHQFCG